MFITEAGAGMLKELERIITQSKQSRGNREALGNNVSNTNVEPVYLRSRLMAVDAAVITGPLWLSINLWPWMSPGGKKEKSQHCFYRSSIKCFCKNGNLFSHGLPQNLIQIVKTMARMKSTGFWPFNILTFLATIPLITMDTNGIQRTWGEFSPSVKCNIGTNVSIEKGLKKYLANQILYIYLIGYWFIHPWLRQILSQSTEKKLSLYCSIQ